jgi:hypothetical protein
VCPACSARNVPAGWVRITEACSSISDNGLAT